MSWTGSAPNQTYQRTDGVRTGASVCATAKANGVNDTAALCDVREQDIATAISLCLKKDGGNQMTADLPMNTHKLTGLGSGTASTDSITLNQAQTGSLIYATVGGTANAITLATTPSVVAVVGIQIGFLAGADNSSTTTITFNSDGAAALQVGGTACAGGEINNGQFHIVGFDGTQWQLVNPYFSSALYQPIDSDLTAFAALSPSDDDIVQRKAGAWANRTIAQILTDLAAAGTTFQPLDSDLTAIAALTTTSFGRSTLAAANAAALATLAGVGSGDSPTFATPTVTGINIGSTSTTLTEAAAGVIAVEGVPVYSNIPQNSKSAAYTTVLADAQKHILHPTADNNARTFTIDSNANVAYPIGSAITFINEINTVTISITSDTLVLAGLGTTGSRTLAANGIATALKITATKWVISGTGLT